MECPDHKDHLSLERWNTRAAFEQGSARLSRCVKLGKFLITNDFEEIFPSVQQCRQRSQFSELNESKLRGREEAGAASLEHSWADVNSTK
jgi:hypothetical protein